MVRTKKAFLQSNTTKGPHVKTMRLIYGKLITNRDQLELLHFNTEKQFTKVFATWPQKKEVNIFTEIAPAIYDVMGSTMFKREWMNTSR